MLIFKGMMKIAIFSDTHGKWDEMYDRAKGCDIILHCGDIETLLSNEDLPYFPAPSKFKKQYENGVRSYEFKKYWDKGKVPVLTYFIAGNHENWKMLYKYIKGPVKLIENLYYFGNYGIVKIENIVIAGFSKIFHHNYSYLNSPIRWKPNNKNPQSPKIASYFHVEDLMNLIELAKDYEKIDILLLHENPLGEFYGCKEITELIEALNPKYVFCGHMHWKGERKLFNSIVINIEENGVYYLDF